jgi:glutamate racemase
VSFISERVHYIAQALIKKDIKALVIACNTATVNAIEQLRSKVNIPVIGVEPAIKPAAQLSINKKIAILATQATSTNPRFNALVANHNNGAEVIIQPCPGLVEFIEQGQQNSKACNQLLKSYLEPLLQRGVDTLVLGCTHYPFVLSQILKITGGNISIIETSEPVTLQLSKQLAIAKLCADNTQTSQYHFYSSQPNEQLQTLMSLMWKSDIVLHSI